MTDIENAKIWMPVETIPYEILDIEEISFCGSCLTIILCDDNNKFKFIFEDMIGGMCSYKCTSLYANFEFNEKLGKCLDKNNLKGKVFPLFSLSDSQYIQQLKEQTVDYYECIYNNFEHYIFVTYDIVIEVVSSAPPKVVCY